MKKYHLSFIILISLILFHLIISSSAIPQSTSFDNHPITIETSLTTFNPTKELPKSSSTDISLDIIPENKENRTISGTWGTTSWTFYEDLNYLQFINQSSSNTTLGLSENSPWNTKIKAENIHQIVFQQSSLGGNYIMNANSMYLFSSADPDNHLINLQSISGLERVKTSNVTNMSGVFEGTLSLKELDINSWNTENVTSINNMFANVTTLKSLDLSNWNTSNITGMIGTFRNMTSLEKINIYTWNTSKVNNMGWMFTDTKNLAELDLSNWNTRRANLNSPLMKDMFVGTEKLTKVTLGPNTRLVNTELSKVEEKQTNPVLSGYWKNSTKSWSGKSIDLETLTQDKLFSGDTYIWEKHPVWGNVPWTFDTDSGILTLHGDSIKNPELATYRFSPWEIQGSNQPYVPHNKIKIIDIKGKDIKLKTLNISNWNTQNLKYIDSMFYQASALKKLDLSGWNTSNVTNTELMFSGTTKLDTLSLSNWNTSNVTNMYSMFEEMSNIEELNLSKWDTQNVTDMENMFSSTNKLKKITLGERTILHNTNLPNPATPDSSYTARWKNQSDNWRGTSSELEKKLRLLHKQIHMNG